MQKDDSPGCVGLGYKGPYCQKTHKKLLVMDGVVQHRREELRSTSQWRLPGGLDSLVLATEL